MTTSIPFLLSVSENNNVRTYIPFVSLNKKKLCILCVKTEKKMCDITLILISDDNFFPPGRDEWLSKVNTPIVQSTQLAPLGDEWWQRDHALHIYTYRPRTYTKNRNIMQIVIYYKMSSSATSKRVLSQSRLFIQHKFGFTKSHVHDP